MGRSVCNSLRCASLGDLSGLRVVIRSTGAAASCLEIGREEQIETDPRVWIYPEDDVQVGTYSRLIPPWS